MKKTFNIKGMHCNACAMLIEQEFDGKKGIKKISVDFRTENADIEFDEKVVSESEIKRIIKNAGYDIK